MLRQCLWIYNMTAPVQGKLQQGSMLSPMKCRRILSFILHTKHRRGQHGHQMGARRLARAKMPTLAL